MCNILCMRVCRRKEKGAAVLPFLKLCIELTDLWYRNWTSCLNVFVHRHKCGVTVIQELEHVAYELAVRSLCSIRASFMATWSVFMAHLTRDANSYYRYSKTRKTKIGLTYTFSRGLSWYVLHCTVKPFVNLKSTHYWLICFLVRLLIGSLETGWDSLHLCCYRLLQ